MKLQISVPALAGQQDGTQGLYSFFGGPKLGKSMH